MKLANNGEEQPLVVVKVKTRGEILCTVLSYPTANIKGISVTKGRVRFVFFHLDIQSANSILLNIRILKPDKNYALQ